MYDRPLQFVYDFDNESHSLDNESYSLNMRIIFHIFRYKFKKNGETFCKTCINLDSFYPVGNINKIMFKRWEKNLKESSSCKEQQRKFCFAKKLFRNTF